LTDEDSLKTLMLRSLRGDRPAYVELLTLLAEELRPFFRRRLPSAADEAEDLVQETLIAIHQKRQTYDPALPVRAWIFAIARYKLIDRQRRAARAATVSLDDLDELKVEQSPDHEHAQSDLAAMLDRLPEKQAAAIQLVKVQGFSVAETARRTGQSVSSVKVGVHRGIKKLLSRFGGSNR
jgi:RNA polymerase sigma-70 factor (ECF subfamily)